MNSLSRIPPSLAEPPLDGNPALLLGLYEFLLRAQKLEKPEFRNPHRSSSACYNANDSFAV